MTSKKRTPKKKNRQKILKKTNSKKAPKRTRKDAVVGSTSKRMESNKATSGKGSPKQTNGLKQSEKKTTFRKVAGLVGILGAIASIVMFLVWMRGRRISRTPPKIAVKYLRISSEGESRVELQEIPITPSLDDVNNSVLRVPINLALQNLENRTLEPQSIIVGYPRNLRLESSGEDRIDSAEHQWIYEHKIDPLEPGSHFTPLKTFEHLLIEVRYKDLTTAIITADGVPTLVSPKIGVPKGFKEIPETLSFDLSIHFKDRAPYESQMNVKIMPAYVYGGLSFEWEEGQAFDITAEDLDFAATLLEAERSTENPDFSVIDHWNAIDPYSQSVIDYKKVIYMDNTIQLLRIGPQLRRIVVDKESDSFADYELWDITKDGILDKKCLPNKKQKMIDWKNSMVNSQSAP